MINKNQTHKEIQKLLTKGFKKMIHKNLCFIKMIHKISSQKGDSQKNRLTKMIHKK